MALAHWLLPIVRVLRLLSGRRGVEARCRRRGVHWSLDLREGVQLALYLGLYERTTSRRLLELVDSGSVVIDVGANVGVHALPLARAVGGAGRVVAIEPTAAAVTRLRANGALNPELGARLIVVQAAVGAPGGALEPEYYSAWPLTRGPSRHPVHLGAGQSTANARFSTLDDLVSSLGLGAVTLIKIDVDGRELDVLSGAVGVIRRDRPTVVFEVCPYLLTAPGHSARDLVEFFTANGYELLDERTLRPVGTDPVRILAPIPELGGRNLIARARPRPDRPDGLTAA